MDNKRQNLLKIFSGSPRLLCRGQAEKITDPRHLINDIVQNSGPHALLLHLSSAGLKNVIPDDPQRVVYSDHAVHHESCGFITDQVFDSSLLSEPLVSYSPAVSKVLSGTSADLSWSKKYVAAELNSLSQYGATALTRVNDALWVEFGVKKMPFRNLSLIERGFVAENIRVNSTNNGASAVVQKVFASMKVTRRSLFFVCGDFCITDIKNSLSMLNPTAKVVDFESFKQDAPGILRQAASRKEQLLVISEAIDSVSLYASIRSIVDKDLFMSNIGGIWSRQVLPKLCSKCKKTTKKASVSKIEHGITLGGLCAESGGGCAHCLYGYRGVQEVDETIDESCLSFFIAAIERFEKKKQENNALQPLALLSEYAADGKIESIYQVLSKHLKLLDVTNGDAQLMLL